MIDIHCHVLWHLDDGARDFDTAVGLCRTAVNSSITHLVATPHLIYWESAAELMERRDRKLGILQDTIDAAGMHLELLPGFEILCDDEIFSQKHLEPFTLNESRYILIEFDFRRTTEEDVSSWCDYLCSMGLVPIIAHPERYGFILSDETAVERLGKKKILFQLNCGSAVGMFGEEEAKMAIRLIHGGYCDLIGSDAHTLHRRTTDMRSVLSVYPPSVSKEVLQKALFEMPDRVLRDLPFNCGERGDLRRY